MRCDKRVSLRKLRAGLLGTAIVGVITLTPAFAWAGQKVALVVGNGAYESITSLDNPPRDASLIADKLRSLDFDVFEVIDGDRAEMEQALREFGRRAAGADAALFFYAGHGVQESGENYLLPVSATVEEKGDLPYETLQLSMVMDELEHAAAGVSVVVLDACRDNPLSDAIGEQSTRSLQGNDGLATVRGATGTLIAYATAPGEVAYDGVGANSPFSTALAEWIDEPGLEIGLMLRRVRQDVVEATEGSQVPWVEEAILGDFYFVEGTREVAPQVSGAARPFDIANADAVFWRTVTEMKTEEERRAGLNLYKDVFPSGQYISEAQAQLTSLDAGQAVVGQALALSDVSAPGAGAFTDLLFWERVRQSSDPADFQSYLDSYPDGLFAGVATERLSELQQGTQIAALDSNLFTRRFTIPFGSQTHTLSFQQAEINRAMATVPTARVKELPTVGDILIGPKAAFVGDQISEDDLRQALYIPPSGVTGPLGRFALGVTEPNGTELVLSADIDIRYPEKSVREIAATAGVGPVPITIPLPAMSGGEERDLVIDALPNNARVLTASHEVGVNDRIAVKDGVAELAIALPQDMLGEAGEIVYSYEPGARGLRESTKSEGAGALRQEAISIAGIDPSYSAQSSIDVYIGVGSQPLPVTLPEDSSTKVLIEEIPFGDLKRAGGSDLVIGDYLPASELAELSFEAHRHLTGPIGQLAYSYQTPESDRLMQAVAINAAIHDCDLLASSPLDPNRVSDGKWAWRARGQGWPAETYLDAPAAIMACLSASEAYPNVDRFKRQVGRSYTSAKDYENALKWIVPLAEKGNILAISGVAYHYTKGWGVPIDYDKAFELNWEAANKGEIAAAHELGKAYRDGRGVERDYEQAAKWIKVASDWGLEWAQLNLGKFYRDGLGVPRDDKKAAELFRKVYEQKNAWGNLDLGRMYLEGRGVPKDVDRAVELFSEIPLLDEVEWALYELGRIYREGKSIDRDIPQAINLFEQASELGVAVADTELAKIYLYGEDVPADPERAVTLLESAASEGAHYAYYLLAQEYQAGKHLPKNIDRSLALYEQGMTAGSSISAVALGDLYRRGQDVPQDLAAARRFFDQAASEGEPYGMMRLAEMDVKGEGGPVDLDNAVALYGKALKAARRDDQRRNARKGLEGLPKPALTRSVQVWLQQEGFDPGVPDGISGARTRTAIEAFERSKGMAPTGQVSADLVAALAP